MGEDPRLILWLTLFFVCGLIGGAAVVRGMSPEHSAELAGFLDLSLAGLSTAPPEGSLLARKAWVQNLGFTLLLGFLGLTAIGVPVVLALITWRGFTLGFTVGFLIAEKASAGLLISALAVLPPNVFYIPGFFLAGAAAINLSLRLLRGGRFSFPLNWWEQVGGYLAVLVMALALVAVGGLLEAYLSPGVMRWVVSRTYG
ncbi:MAG: stage II sporulation protein M [Clostridia bacterium]|jgi:stage II sporulation protein M|nr:stage II sporulation protein M [Clostridia bacterium]MDH7572686.1 stage II sporulation protein M [Clostridia bacterium]